MQELIFNVDKDFDGTKAVDFIKKQGVSDEIIKNSVEVDSTDEFLKEGMDYNWETGEFCEHIEEVIPQIIEEIIEEVVEDVTEE